MIRYALSCDRDHRFDSWFPSAAAFDRLAAGGHLACPDCGSAQVGKALMAPSVATRDGGALTAPPQDPRAEALARLRREVEAKSEYVGMRFATEARAIHAGDAPERSIWGETRPDEARALIEEGVPVAPLPFLPTRKAN
jgi:hypothetical protein